ncbi:MAG: prepilin-type N-terminal cleavage/methylation domain-containing protein [Deltaproteobacteria bacterium]
MSSCVHHKKILERGFSLVELLVTIAIIATVSSIAALNISQWRVKSGVEAQLKQMMSDISELRVRALTMKLRHSITFNASSYVFKSYSTDDQPLTGGTVIPTGTHSVVYRLKDKNNAYYDGSAPYEVDARGMLVGSKASVFLDYNGTASTDCLTLHTVRVNPGKKNAAGDTCNDQ